MGDITFVYSRLEGDTAVADITFVPTQREEQLTCEATNEAVSQPFRQSIQVIQDGINWTWYYSLIPKSVPDGISK